MPEPADALDELACPVFVGLGPVEANPHLIKKFVRSPEHVGRNFQLIHPVATSQLVRQAFILTRIDLLDVPVVVAVPFSRTTCSLPTISVVSLHVHGGGRA